VSLRRALAPVVGAGVAVGAGLTAYALWEARQYTLREVSVPVLPSGSRPLRVLHVSDIHMTPGQQAKQEWLRGLARLEPDLVVNTGDNLSHRGAVPVVLDCLSGLLDRPGVFVLGSNDYYEPGLRNPLGYLAGPSNRTPVRTPQLPWGELRDGFRAAGWCDLSNTRDRLEVGGTDIALTGVDDPHLRFDDLGSVAGPAPTDADLRLAVAHAPYQRVLDQFAGDGYDLVLAGHTHGGQVCLPGVGALTSNCDLDTDRVKGLHRHPSGSRPGDDRSAWLHVSAGVGTSTFTRIRVACRPEATLLTLTPREA
jgi:predicted MPP superfamily phosphohydrolase